MGLRNGTNDVETSSTCYQNYLKLKNMKGEVYVTLSVNGATQITFMGTNSHVPPVGNAYSISDSKLLETGLLSHTLYCTVHIADKCAAKTRSIDLANASH